MVHLKVRAILQWGDGGDVLVHQCYKIIRRAFECQWCNFNSFPSDILKSDKFRQHFNIYFRDAISIIIV